MHSPPNPATDASVARFRRWAWVVAVFALLVSGFAPLLLRPRVFDFSQYYAGAVASWENRWDALYPVPAPGSSGNPGHPDCSHLKPEMLQMLADRNVSSRTYRFIQSPAFALMCTPLAWFDFGRAHHIWVAISVFCAGLILHQAVAMCDLLIGRPTRLALIVVLVVACSPIVSYSIRMSNCSAIVGALIGSFALNLARRYEVRAGMAAALAAVIKYVTLPLLPLMLIARREVMVMWWLVIASLVTAAALAVAGSSVCGEYLGIIIPTLAAGQDDARNMSVAAFLSRNLGLAPELTPAIRSILTFARIAGFAAILLLCHGRRRTLNVPANLLAAVSVILTWTLLFAPIFWDHYMMYLLPLWGWVAWEMTQSRIRAAAGAAIMAMSWISTSANMLTKMPEPLNSHLMFATIVIMGLGISRLCAGTPAAGNAATTPSPTG